MCALTLSVSGPPAQFSLFVKPPPVDSVPQVDVDVAVPPVEATAADGNPESQPTVRVSFNVIDNYSLNK